MSVTPRVSVLLPVYNGETYLRQAIESILNQTFRDFEFILINDGSTDGTPQIIAEYANHDARIRAFDQPNQGLVATLNRSIELARGEYLARMDADDIALPERLAKQVAFLDKHREVGIIGTARIVIDAQGKPVEIKRLPDSDLRIRWLSLLASPFAHPSVMIRRALLIEKNLRYDSEFIHIEDYELWMRLLRHTHGANLPEPLIKYREYPFSVSVGNREFRMRRHDQVAQRMIQEYLANFSIAPEDLHILRELLAGGGDPLPDLSNRVVRLAHTYLDMFEAFARLNQGSIELKRVSRDAVVNAMRIISRAPSSPGTRRVITRLFRLDPLVPFSLLVLAPGVFYRRLRRIVSA